MLVELSQDPSKHEHFGDVRLLLQVGERVRAQVHTWVGTGSFIHGGRVHLVMIGTRSYCSGSLLRPAHAFPARGWVSQRSKTPQSVASTV